jgi:hypothetical protein
MCNHHLQRGAVSRLGQTGRVVLELLGQEQSHLAELVQTQLRGLIDVSVDEI